MGKFSIFLAFLLVSLLAQTSATSSCDLKRKASEPRKHAAPVAKKPRASTTARYEVELVPSIVRPTYTETYANTLGNLLYTPGRRLRSMTKVGQCSGINNNKEVSSDSEGHIAEDLLASRKSTRLQARSQRKFTVAEGNMHVSEEEPTGKFKKSRRLFADQSSPKRSSGPHSEQKATAAPPRYIVKLKAPSAAKQEVETSKQAENIEEPTMDTQGPVAEQPIVSTISSSELDDSFADFLLKDFPDYYGSLWLRPLPLDYISMENLLLYGPLSDNSLIANEDCFFDAEFDFPQLLGSRETSFFYSEQ